ncbi:MAG: hypothetical protein JNM67_05105 [Bacteroidetes bacterium]|nr:hypothetical protein [Bacteroidota bacterium]
MRFWWKRDLRDTEDDQIANEPEPVYLQSSANRHLNQADSNRQLDELVFEAWNKIRDEFDELHNRDEWD